MRPDDHRWLKYSALFYALGLALHTADHFRRGLDASTSQVLIVGNLSTALGITVAVMVIVGYRHAALLAALTGFPVAFGVASVHLLPEWSAFSDTFVNAHNTGVTAMSWTVVLVEIAGALALGVAGLAAVRDDREIAGVSRAGSRSAGAPGRLRRGDRRRRRCAPPTTARSGPVGSPRRAR